MLIIPAIEIHDCRCLRTVKCDPGIDPEVYSNDPIQMALLWRRENAKVLHVLDREGVYNGSMENRDTIVDAVRTVEIPVQLISSFADVEECESWLRGGIYRIFVHDLIQNDPDGVRRLLREFGPSRICAAAITRDGRLSPTWRDLDQVDTVAFGHAAKELGIGRMFFTDRNYEGVLRGPNFDELRRLANETSLHVTAAGGVATVEHLWMLQEMESLGVDSVVIGRAFYENCFPCQQLWRDIEIERRRTGTDWKEQVSTSLLARDGAAGCNGGSHAPDEDARVSRKEQ